MSSATAISSSIGSDTMAEPQPTLGWPARPQRFTDPPITGSATRKLPAAPTPPPANADAASDLSAADRRRWARDVDQALAPIPFS